MTFVKGYSLEDAVRFYRWAGHEGSFTELCALHPRYKPGQENLEWNRLHNAFPITAYSRNESDLARFLEGHKDSGRMLCMGLNPRPQAFKNGKGYARSAREEEIVEAKSILFDLDYADKSWKPAGDDGFGRFKKEADDRFRDLGFKPPAYSSTGRGYHLLFAYPAIKLSECLDFSERIGKFAHEFKEDLHKELAELNLTLDSTFDSRRMVRIPGTAKPSIGLISRFHGGAREEDAALASYLLSMNVAEEPDRFRPMYGASLIAVYGRLPPVVENLMLRDPKLKALWTGNGKPEDQDQSGSGYDYSLARRLIVLGVRDVDVIGTAIALRPGSSYEQKDERYLRRTIAKALMG